MRVIGTAGHVDHGKSTLVEALSGIDPDRLKEEKARGMTIDLGFAWINLPILESADDQTLSSASPVEKSAKHSSKSTKPSQKSAVSNKNSTPMQTVGIVDVPGHIDFIKNMLAGIGSVDACVLVISADEGVMPQTREHLAILDLLAVPAGVVALTKIDLIEDEEWLDLVELDVVELLQETRLENAPIIRVSANTGTGLEELKSALAATLAELAPRRDRARPRLPADRIFSLSGFGTVVTGTLSDGLFSTGDPVEILPQGISARIRGLQTHSKQIEEGKPGSRLAMNLSGVGVDEIRRGDVITKPGTLRSTILIDVNFRLLSDASKAVVHNQVVTFFSGATEISARLRLLGSETVEPGQTGWLQLRLNRPTVVAAGDRYILRQPSPSVTLGGGTILSPHPRRRWRRFDSQVIERLNTLAKGEPTNILLQVLARNLFLATPKLIEQSGLDVELAQKAIKELQEAGAIFDLQLGKSATYLSVGTWQQLNETLKTLLQQFHSQNPLRIGIQREELRNRLKSKTGTYREITNVADISVRFFNALLDAILPAGEIEANDSVVWLAYFKPTLTEQQQKRIEQLLALFDVKKHAPPNANETLAVLGEDEKLLDYLIDSDQLIRIGDGILFRQETFVEMVNEIQGYMRENGSISLAQVRDLFQTSRKYAQALLEEMDSRRITRRDGDIRLLR